MSCAACASNAIRRQASDARIAQLELKAKSWELTARTAGGAFREQERQIASLFDAIKHGDAEHRAWLKKSIEKHFKAT